MTDLTDRSRRTKRELKLRIGAAAVDNIAEVNAAQSLGGGLRMAREGLGKSLGEAAAALRIRERHLAAIEDDRFDDLPGAAYVAGFLRAYADYLGLDSQSVLARYREDVTDAKEEPSLKFPVPQAERRIPSGAVLMISAILAVFVYAGWYALSSSGEGEFEGADGTSALVMSELERLGQDGLAAPKPRGADPTVSVAATRDDASSPMTDTPSVGTESPASTSAALLARQSETAAASPAASPDEGTVVEKTDKVASTTDEEAKPAAIAALPTGAGSGRIVIRAIDDSWVQVRDGNKTLRTGILQRGESYAVPNQPGLLLTTGNAGALEIIVDETRVPPLGPRGAVRHAVALDRDRLLAGHAVLD